MKSLRPIAMVLAACTSGTPAAAQVVGETAPAVETASDAKTSALEVDATWSKLAVPIGVAHDGRRWIGAVEHDLVVFDGDREVTRFSVMAAGSDRLAALPGGGWVAGARLLGADGKIRFDGHGWGNRFGRFGSAKAMAVSPAGTVAIIAGADSPSTCIRDRKCGNAGGSRGALARLTFDPDGKDVAPSERLLIEHENRRDFVVAASDTWVAAIEGQELSVWPAIGDGAPRTATIAGSALSTLAWAGDRWLVGTRWVDVEHTEIVVLDGDAGYAVSAAWIAEGTIHGFAVRPDGTRVAIGTSWYRARTRVEVDEKRIELYASTVRCTRASTSPPS